MKLSVVIPVYNEENTLIEIIKRVKAAHVGDVEKEIILVDDGSSDKTKEILKKVIEPMVDKVIYNDKNMGKGSALKTGFKNITGDIVIIQDADLEYDPQEFRRLIKPILEDKADVVYGSRFMGGRPHRVQMFWHKVGNNILTTLSNMFTNLNLTDTETCYKVFKKSIIDAINIEEKRFGVDPELTIKVARMKCRIYEVGISYYGRSYEEGKKITWKDGFHHIFVIIKYGIFRRR